MYGCSFSKEFPCCARLLDLLRKENTFGEEYTPHSARSGAGRGDAGASRGAAIPLRPQGQGLGAPAASRRSARSRPGPAAARRQAARPRRRRRRAESGPPQSGPETRPARRARSAQLTFRLRRAPRPESPARQPPRRLGGGGRPHPRPRPRRLTELCARSYLSWQAGVSPQRPRRQRLPPGRRIPAPSANHNTKRAAGRGEGVGLRADMRLRETYVTMTRAPGPGLGEGGAGSTCGLPRAWCRRASWQLLDNSVCAAAGGRKRARRRSRREDDEGVSSRDKGQFPPEKWGKSERRDRILTGLCVLGPEDEGIVPF